MPWPILEEKPLLRLLLQVIGSVIAALVGAVTRRLVDQPNSEEAGRRKAE